MTSNLSDVAIVALLAFVPLVVLMLTSFVKVSVVLSLLRNAIGATDAPSGLVVMGISLILTFFVMAPVAVEMVTAAGASAGDAAPAGRGAGPADGTSAAQTATNATTPATNATTSAANSDPARPAAPVTAPAPDLMTALRTVVPAERRAQVDALGRALGPLKGFLAKHASERDVATFVDLGAKLGQARGKDDLAVLAPAFLTTELREAFAIAVLIFVPFLVIDLLVGLGLAALGLSSTSPQTVALPIKLLLFVAVDGWRLLIDALLRGYA